MKAIIVGAGGTTRELLRGMADRWDIMVIDPDEERLHHAQKGRNVEVVVGDGSSRVVLERAGISGAEAVIAASSDDEVNLEVCRIAIELGIHRIAAVARDPDRLPEFRDLKVPAFSRARLTARRIEMQIEPRRVTSAGFADGLAEAIEFQVTPDSPVLNRPLRDLHSETWLVAAVLRDGSLIVPHGDTYLRNGDLVTVVGAASDYSAIVELFTSGQARFPLDVGKKIVTVAEHAADLDGHVTEAAQFIHASAAESLVVFHEDPSVSGDDQQSQEIETILGKVAGLASGFEIRTRAVPRSPLKDLSRIAIDEGAGLIVLPSVGRNGRRSGTRPSQALALVRSTGIPLLLAAGSQPYRRILLEVRDSPSGEAAARAAIDLAVFGSADLQAVAVVPPAFLASSQTMESARTTLGRLREDAAIHDVTIDDDVIEGNPVQVISAMCAVSDLLVIGAAADARQGRNITRYLVRRSPISMLIVPSRSAAPA